MEIDEILNVIEEFKKDEELNGESDINTNDWERDAYDLLERLKDKFKIQDNSPAEAEEDVLQSKSFSGDANQDKKEGGVK